MIYQNILDNMYEGVYILDLNLKIRYWSKGAEGLSGFKASEVIGTSCSENILMHTDKKGQRLCGTSSCVAARVLKVKSIQKDEIFLNHKKGHRLLVVTRAFPAYDLKGRLTGVVEIFSNMSTQVMLDNKTKELQKFAMVDSLTGVSNRRYLEMQLESRLERLRRYKWPFSVFFIDIDGFKKINDTFGHDAGDKVLKVVAGTLQQGIRSYDLLSRWGGEEFVISIENINKEDMNVMGNKLCRLVSSSYIREKDDNIQVTISVGATLAGKEDTIDSLVKRADTLMYRCKARGGNCLEEG